MSEDFNQDDFLQNLVYVDDTSNRLNVTIQADSLPNNWNDQGVYINASNETKTFNSIDIPAFTIVTPFGETVNIPIPTENQHSWIRIIGSR